MHCATVQADSGQWQRMRSEGEIRRGENLPERFATGVGEGEEGRGRGVFSSGVLEARSRVTGQCSKT